MNIGRAVRDHVGPLPAILLASGGIFIIVCVSILLSIRITEALTAESVSWASIGWFLALTISNALFVLCVMVVFKRANDIFEIQNLALQRRRMESITESFLADNNVREQARNGAGILGCLDQLTAEFHDVNERMYSAARALQYFRDNVVLINSEEDNHQVLKSFFDDPMLSRHINEIQEIHFHGTGRGAVNGANRAYNFYAPFSEFLKKVFSDTNAQLSFFRCIGARVPEQQACLRAFIARLALFMLKDVDFSRASGATKTFRMEFIFPHDEVFPGMLTIGRIKAMFNVPLAIDDAEAVIEKMPLALQVNAKAQDEAGTEQDVLPSTVQRIHDSFLCRFNDYGGSVEAWSLGVENVGAGHAIRVSVSGRNPSDLRLVDQKIQGNRGAYDGQFASNNVGYDVFAEFLAGAETGHDLVFTQEAEGIDRLKKLIRVFGTIGYGQELPSILNV